MLKLPRLIDATLLLIILSLITPSLSQAAPTKALIDQKIIEETRAWLSAPVVSLSIDAQNKKYKEIDEKEIDKLDKQWRKERDLEDQPLIAATLSSPLSNYLTQIQAASVGAITEMFVVDAKGLNVGQSSITSDYWQGDEDKYQKTFLVGPKAVFVDTPEYNEETKTWRTQLNMTIANEANVAIGAITIEYNLTELERRQMY